MPDAVEPVSVVMPVRNAMPFLDAAIESILAQTHRDFELIIGDDGSTDGSSECLASWARRDPRIRLLHNDGAALGPSGAANWVAHAAHHRLIARMDADDVAMPERLAKGVQALRNHPDAVVVGSLCDYIDANDRRIFGRDRSIFRNPRVTFPCAHASMMFRRDIFERIGGYRRECDYWEDLDLFLRLEKQGRVLILSDILLRYRISPTSSRHVSNEVMVARQLELCVRCGAAASEGADYETIIAGHRQAPPLEQVSLMVVALVAFERLWRGQPRSIFNSWAWRHSSFARVPRRGRMLVFLAWLWLNPPSLRAFLKAKARVRSWRARHAVPEDGVHVWRGAAARGPAAPPMAPAQTPPRRPLFTDPAPVASGPILAAAGASPFREAVAHAPPENA